MTKSLLTQEDIKSFILEEIEKYVRCNYKCYTMPELSKILNVPENILVYHKRYIRMSYIDKGNFYYNIDVVIKYLREHNIYYEYKDKVE